MIHTLQNVNCQKLENFLVCLGNLTAVRGERLPLKTPEIAFRLSCNLSSYDCRSRRKPNLILSFYCRYLVSSKIQKNLEHCQSPDSQKYLPFSSTNQQSASKKIQSAFYSPSNVKTKSWPNHSGIWAPNNTLPKFCTYLWISCCMPEPILLSMCSSADRWSSSTFSKGYTAEHPTWILFSASLISHMNISILSISTP